MVLGEYWSEQSGYFWHAKSGQVFLSLRDERREIVRRRMEKMKAEEDSL